MGNAPARRVDSNHRSRHHRIGHHVLPARRRRARESVAVDRQPPRRPQARATVSLAGRSPVSGQDVTRKLLRRLTLLAALALLAGLVLPVLPAQAINCDYGDNFYQFHADQSWDYTATVTDPSDGNQYLEDVSTGGTLFCQTASETGGDGLGYSEWVQKNTSNCLTYDASARQRLSLIPCAYKDSQYWTLQDPLGGPEHWGYIKNMYGTEIAMWDEGYANSWVFGACESFTSP